MPRGSRSNNKRVAARRNEPVHNCAKYMRVLKSKINKTMPDDPVDLSTQNSELKDELKIQEESAEGEYLLRLQAAKENSELENELHEYRSSSAARLAQARTLELEQKVADQDKIITKLTKNHDDIYIYKPRYENYKTQIASWCRQVDGLCDELEVERANAAQGEEEFLNFKEKTAENQEKIMRLCKTRFPEVWKLGRKLGWK